MARSTLEERAHRSTVHEAGIRGTWRSGEGQLTGDSEPIMFLIMYCFKTVLDSQKN